MGEDLHRRLRRHTGRQMVPELRVRLEQALGQPVPETDFLDLEATERLRAEFFDRVRSRHGVTRMTWRASEVQDVWRMAESIGRRMGEARAVLFHWLNRYIGAVVVPVGPTLGRAEEVRRAVREDLCLTSPDLSSGLCLAFDHYPDRDEWELITWGAFGSATFPSAPA